MRIPIRPISDHRPAVAPPPRPQAQGRAEQGRRRPRARAPGQGVHEPLEAPGARGAAHARQPASLILCNYHTLTESRAVRLDYGRISVLRFYIVKSLFI